MQSSAMLVSGLLLVLLCSSCVSAQTRDLQAVSTVSQTSISWNRSVTGGDPLAKLQFNDSRLANTAGGLDPSQVFVLAVRFGVRVSHRQSCFIDMFILPCTRKVATLALFRTDDQRPLKNFYFRILNTTTVP